MALYFFIVPIKKNILGLNKISNVPLERWLQVL
jgi:hypothetical protein